MGDALVWIWFIFRGTFWSQRLAEASVLKENVPRMTVSEDEGARLRWSEEQVWEMGGGGLGRVWRSNSLTPPSVVNNMVSLIGENVS